MTSRRISAAVLSLALFSLACAKKDKGAGVKELRKAVVDRGDLVLTVPLQGTFDAYRRFDLSPPKASTVVEMAAHPGQAVRRGQVLARLRTRDAQLLIGAAEAGLEQAKVANDPAQLEAAEKDLDFARKQYPDALILAPGPGFVVQVASKEGENFIPGANPLITLGDRVVVRIKANQMDAALLRPGQKATVRAEAFPDLPLDTKVLSVAASGNKNDWESDKYITFAVVLDMPAKSPIPLRLGMSADADVEIFRKEKVLRLPREFINREAAVAGSPTPEPYCYVGAVNPESKKTVILGDHDRTHVEILKGLTEGQTVNLPLKDVANKEEWW